MVMTQLTVRIVTASALVLGVAAFPCVVSAQSTGKEVVSVPNAPQPAEPYSHGIRVGNLVFVAGQLPVDPKTNQPIEDKTIEAQTRRVLDNIKTVLEAAGMDMDNVVSTTVFMADVNEFQKMNEVYATYFKEKPPARTTVQVARVRRDAKIEINAIAAK
jgi:2-iminobutanoate/2-iminopropanoate deaminase